MDKYDDLGWCGDHPHDDRPVKISDIIEMMEDTVFKYEDSTGTVYKRERYVITLLKETEAFLKGLIDEKG